MPRSFYIFITILAVSILNPNMAFSEEPSTKKQTYLEDLTQIRSLVESNSIPSAILMLSDLSEKLLGYQKEIVNTYFPRHFDLFIESTRAEQRDSLDGPEMSFGV